MTCYQKDILWCLADLPHSLPLLFFCYKEESVWCLTKALSKSQRVQWQQLVFDKVYHWQCVARQLFRIYTHMHTWVHTFSHIHPRTHTYSCAHTLSSIPADVKRGKTCRHGRLSKQLQQIETKLNLKPGATPATERLWQIWRGRKGSAAGPKGGRDAGENGRCGSQR